MSQIIKILDEHTANQIAAGEVVDRPASVVKELLENAIDAGANRIEVRLGEGGIDKIQVLDNGRGMNREDCILALSRHATSKISSVNDLLSIRTLGFRGEALPSIAAVSKMQLISKEIGAIEGTSLYLEGGKLLKTDTVGCSTGTEITVEDLFFNIPARKKYLKKPATEANHTINVVQRLALAYPEFSFQLWHNGQQIFSTSGTGSLKDILIDLYGLEFAENMAELSYLTPGFNIWGMIGKSFQHRSNRDRQIFIVNGRYVRSLLMQKVLEEAYKGLLPSRRYPVGVICLDISPEILDVNVHPAKLEIKFANPEQISSNLGIALAKALTETSHIISTIDVKEPAHNFPRRTERVKEAVETYLQTQWDPPPAQYIKANMIDQTAGQVNKEGKIINQSKQVIISGINGKPQLPEGNPQFPVLRAIGQLHEIFILAQGSGELYIIDQHGAHERINYERLYDQIEQQSPDTQFLAIPTTLELNSVESELLISIILQLTDLGIIIEHFGKNTFLVRGVPLGLTGEEASELVIDLLQRWNNQIFSELESVDNILKMVACKQSVKANMSLTLEEQQILLEKLSQLRQPFTCPHGRPIIISYGLKELRRRFGRN